MFEKMSYKTVDKGTLLVECGNLLAKAKYQIKVLNLINFKKSMHYNPFMYIHSEKDILKLVNTIIANSPIRKVCFRRKETHFSPREIAVY